MERIISEILGSPLQTWQDEESFAYLSQGIFIQQTEFKAAIDPAFTELLNLNGLLW